MIPFLCSKMLSLILSFWLHSNEIFKKKLGFRKNLKTIGFSTPKLRGLLGFIVKIKQKKYISFTYLYIYEYNIYVVLMLGPKNGEVLLLSMVLWVRTKFWFQYLVGALGHFQHTQRGLVWFRVASRVSLRDQRICMPAVWTGTRQRRSIWLTKQKGWISFVIWIVFWSYSSHFFSQLEIGTRLGSRLCSWWCQNVVKLSDLNGHRSARDLSM